MGVGMIHDSMTNLHERLVPDPRIEPATVSGLDVSPTSGLYLVVLMILNKEVSMLPLIMSVWTTHHCH